MAVRIVCSETLLLKEYFVVSFSMRTHCFYKRFSSLFPNSCVSSKRCVLSPLQPSLSGKRFCPFFNLINQNSNISFVVPIRNALFRSLHTTEQRHFHPAFWFAIKPLLKLFAVLSGRGFRKWWQDLPPNKKQHFLNLFIENKNRILGAILGVLTLCLFYYISHLEETPITKRRRFMAFNPQQLKAINEYEFQQIMSKMQGQLLAVNHPSVLWVKRVVDRILAANQHLPGVKGKKWGVAVVDSSIENAFVLPVGYVFVFTGMLNICSNDDQLGIILSHEIAHAIQNHGAENISFVHLLDLISIVFITAIWAVLPSDAISLLTHWLYSKLTQVLLQLPYSRRIETEADEVGLQLAARACFDVRESSAFWAKMAILNQTLEKAPQIEFLSTHPNHETRSEYLDSIMNEALELRRDCKCPSLKPVDPRMEVEVVTRALEAARRKYLQLHPKPASGFYY